MIEISKCPPDGVTTARGKHIAANRVSAWDVHSDERLRLKPGPAGSTDDWFRYDKSLAKNRGRVHAHATTGATWLKMNISATGMEMGWIS